ncbi:MAG: DNA ligase-like domain-containing protein [Planctomycetota bacterium]|jgi:hypothetical protein
MKIATDRYIYPPRAKQAVPRDQLNILHGLGWIAQIKYNDSRCMIKYLPDGHIELWNRHGERFRSYTAPEWLLEQLDQARETLGLQAGELHLLDGGLIDQKHAAIKDTIAIWDILVQNGEQLLGTTYAERYPLITGQRRRILEGTEATDWYYSHETHGPISLGIALTQNILVPRNIPDTEWDKAWDTVTTVNAPYTKGTPGSPNYEIKPLLEGLVLKDPHQPLKPGFRENNNDSWMMRSRVQTGRHLF